MFAKLFSSITESSLWSEPKEVRLLFVTMLAKADQTGYVEASLPGLARVANLSLEETETALECLKAPDPYSKNPEHEGIRVLPVPGGFMLLNYEDYRARRNGEERRDYMRDYMRKYRKKSDGNGKQDVNIVNHSKPPLSQAETETETETSNLNASGFKPPTLEEVTQYCQQKSNGVDPQRFIAHYESTGWRTKTGPVKSWKRCVGTFAQRGNGKPTTTPVVPSDSFEEFWQAYPRKEAKAAARAQYAIAETLTDAATLLKGAKGYARFRKGEEKKYTLTPKRWLEEERWSDEYPVPWYDLQGDDLDKAWEDSINAV